MVRVELTQKEIMLIQGALSLSSKDEFGNELEINSIEEIKELKYKMKKLIELGYN